MSERLESKNFVFEGKTYRTVTVIENGKPEPKKTILRRVISKSEYDKILKDDGATELSKSDSGTTFLVNIGTVNGPIKSKGADFVYTQYADNDFKKLISQPGKNSLTKNLNSGSIEIIKDTLDLSRNEVRKFYPEYANTVAEDVVQGIKFALNDENLPLTFTTGKRRKTYENLFYPEDITSSKQDRIKFGMRFISGKRDIKFNLQNTSDPLFIGNRNTERIEGSVTLPIPGGISDKNSVDFDADSLNVFGAAGAGAVLNPTGAAGAVGNLLSNFINAKPEELQEALTSEGAQNIIAALRLGLAGQVSGSNLFSRLGGGILNPNLELLFKAPALRSFQFNFTMSARSQKEASQIKKIIRFFKQGMSVKKTSNNIFVISPNIFTINYKLGSSTNDHPSIGRIKNCALTDLQTTYGGNTYMTYDDPDRTMTQYTISLDFKELDPITEDDYHAESTGPSIDPDEAFTITSGFPADHIGY